MNKQESKRFKEALAEKIDRHQKELWEWHLSLVRSHAPPFYCSVDLRDSGHKIVPVDSNLFPAGFNNLCPDDLHAAPAVLRAHCEAAASRLGRDAAQKILILPEAHTQNKYYIENIYTLKRILTDARFEVEVGWYSKTHDTPPPSVVTLTSASGKEITAHTLQIESDGTLKAHSFIPDLILLNNDFSSGYPAALDAVAQPILPTYRLGWHSRKKSEHFKYYNELARQFAEIIGIDPWTVLIDTEEVAPVDFNEEVGIEAVAATAEKMLGRMRDSYMKRGIEHDPFVFVKNNHGTYGMGILTLTSADEIRHLNRREKNKMSIGKNHRAIDSIIVQEGIPTATHLAAKEKAGAAAAAEPVIYLIGAELIGGFLRTHAERGARENLNAPGMVFKKFCMSDLRRLDELEQLEEVRPPKRQPTLELVYGSIARLSALAIALELKALG